MTRLVVFKLLFRRSYTRFLISIPRNSRNGQKTNKNLHRPTKGWRSRQDSYRWLAGYRSPQAAKLQSVLFFLMRINTRDLHTCGDSHSVRLRRSLTFHDNLWLSQRESRRKPKIWHPFSDFVSHVIENICVLSFLIPDSESAAFLSRGGRKVIFLRKVLTLESPRPRATYVISTDTAGLQRQRAYRDSALTELYCLMTWLSMHETV